MGQLVGSKPCYYLSRGSSPTSMSKTLPFPRSKLSQIDAELLILDEAAIVRINNFSYKFLENRRRSGDELLLLNNI